MLLILVTSSCTESIVNVKFMNIFELISLFRCKYVSRIIQKRLQVILNFIFRAGIESRCASPPIGYNRPWGSNMSLFNADHLMH